MKKSFKLIILLLALVMLFALAACGGDGGDGAGSADTESSGSAQGSSTGSSKPNNAAGSGSGAGNGGNGSTNSSTDESTGSSSGTEDQKPDTPPAENGTEGFVFEFDEVKGKYKIVGYKGKDTVVTVPTRHENKSVYMLESMGPFDSAKNITSLTIPAGIEAIGLKALEYCTNLESLTVPFVGGGKYILENEYTAEDWGLRMSYILSDGKDVLGNPIELRLKEITVTGGTEIGSSGFWGLDTVTTINLPNTLVKIGDSAFGNCTSLKELHIPESVSSMGLNILQGCSSIEKITVPFLGERDLISLGEEGERFPLGELFMSYGVDEERDLGVGGNSPFYAVFQSRGTSTVDELGQGRWYPIPKTLTSVTVLRGELCTRSFFGMNSLTELVLGDGVISLGNQMIEGCTSLEKINIPDTVKYVGPYAIMNMYHELYSPVLETEIYCDMLYIDNWALKIVNTESSTVKLKPTTIGITSFTECQNTEIFIPLSVKYISYGAFGFSDHSMSIYIEEESSVVGWDDDWNIWGLPTYYSATDKYGVTDGGIKWYLMDNGELAITGSTVTDGSIVTIPAEIDGMPVTTLTTDAFGSGRSNVSGVVIPESIIYAPYGSLCDVTLFFEGASIPNSWESDAISDCPVIFNYGGEQGTEGDFAWIKTKNNSIVLTAYIGDTSVSELVVPSTISGYSVTKVVSGLLKDCYYINKLTIPFIGESATKNDNSFVAFIFGGTSYLDNQSLHITELTVTGGEYMGLNALTYLDAIESLSIPFVGEYADGSGVNHIGHLWGSTELMNNGTIVPEALKTVSVTDTTTIYRYAFCGASHITEIILCDTLATVQEYAFHSCSSITELVIPEAVTYIGMGVVYNCKALIKITIPFVGERADLTGQTHFSHIFTSAESVPALQTVVLSNTQSIPEGAFSNCTTIVTIVLPEGLLSIGNGAFTGCSGIVEVINHSQLIIAVGSSDFGGIAANAVLVHKGESALINQDGFIFCPKGEEYVLVGSTLDKSTKTLYLPYNCNGKAYEIKDYAFANFTGVENIIIEGSVSRIGFGAFINCVNLKSITLPFVGSCYEAPEGENYFGYIFGDPYNTYAQENEYLRTSLTTVTIAYSTTIPDYAFYYNRHLKTINIYNEVTTIGDYAFAYCNSLTSFKVPVFLKSVGEGAFALSYGNSFTDLYINNIEGWCALELTDTSSTPLSDTDNLYINGILTTELTIPTSVDTINPYTFAYATALKKINISPFTTKIGDMAFYYCRGIDEITIPSSVESIGEYAFYNCTGAKALNIDEYSQLKTIGKYAFARCSGIPYVYLPDTLEQIAEYAFENCGSIIEMNIPFVGGLKEPTNDNERYTFGYIFGTVSPYSTSTPTGFVKVHQTFNGGGKSYYIPASLTKLTVRGGEIPKHGLSNCTMLTDITLVDVTKVNASGLYRCTGLVNLDLGVVEELWGASLAECTSLKVLTLPATLTKATGAIYSMTSLEEIVIESGNTCFVMRDNCLIDVGTGTLITAFSGFTIPNDDSIKAIGSYAFYQMSNMPSITIPSSVTSIGASAFSECKGNGNITISVGANVTEMGYRAFAKCTNVTINLSHSTTPSGWDSSWYSSGTNTSVVWKKS